MGDLTLLYYTANKENPVFLANIRKHLVRVSGEGLPLISSTQEPFDFGDNVCVGNLGYSIYNIYVQIYEGAKRVKTPYVACCEDDTLYTKEHFLHRPKNVFAYNVARENVTPTVFYHRKRQGMCTCIAPTELLIQTLETRFKKYPQMPDGSHMKLENLIGFGEPGRFEAKKGLPVVGIQQFTSSPPPVTFNHRMSVGGLRAFRPNDEIREEIPYWGRADKLWKDYFGK